MTLDAVQPATKDYCNCLAQAKGLDPVGYAGTFSDCVLIETPLPWKRDMHQQAGVLPQQAVELMALWLQRYYAGEGYPHLALVIAPDPAYSRAGFRRVLSFTRPAGAFARFDRVEYLVPEADLGALLWALYEDRDALPGFEPYRQPETDGVRDLLVCTHGSVDAACAKFGYPVYRYLRDTAAGDGLRVWRVSHFGGHVFAPTLMDMPTGHYWAYIGEAQADQLVRRTGDVADLRGHYRGWAGLTDGYQQTAEATLWQQHGWQWFDYPKTGEIIARDTPAAGEDPRWSEVRIMYTPPDSDPATVTARVEISQHIETLTTTGEAYTYAHPQYHVTRLD